MTTTTSTPAYTNMARTILGSLTTTFEPPESCHYNAWVGNLNNPYTAWQGVECVEHVVNSMLPAQACWPPTTQGAPLPTSEFMGWGFYSPGLVCPSGFYGACTATATGVAGWNVQFSMLESETAVGCCPTGFACHNAVTGDLPGQTCTKVFSETSLTTARCSFDSYVAEGTLMGGVGTYPLTLTVTTTTHSNLSTITATISALIVSAPMIQINWQPSDLLVASGSTVATASTSAASTSPSSSSSSSSSFANVSSSPSSPTGQVSVATLVGAVVGSILGMALVAAVAFYIWRRKRLAAFGGLGLGLGGGGGGAAGGSGAQLAELDHAGMMIAGAQQQHQGRGHISPRGTMMTDTAAAAAAAAADDQKPFRGTYSELGSNEPALYELPHDVDSNAPPHPQAADVPAPLYSR